MSFFLILTSWLLLLAVYALIFRVLTYYHYHYLDETGHTIHGWLGYLYEGVVLISKPLRSIFPLHGKLDVASLTAAYAYCLLLVGVDFLFLKNLSTIPVWYLWLFYSFIELLTKALFLLSALYLVQFILSMYRTNDFYQNFLANILEPFNRLISRVDLNVGGYNFSLLALFILFQLMSWILGLIKAWILLGLY